MLCSGFFQAPAQTTDQFSFKPENYYYFGISSGFSSANFSLFEQLVQKQVEEVLVMRLDHNVRQRAATYIKAILKMSEKHQVDPFWVMAVAWTESHFKASARSNKGAMGIMQLMPQTQRYLLQKLKRKGFILESEKGEDLIISLLPQVDESLHRKLILQNLELGILYLKDLNKRFQNPFLATVAYNMGPTWTRRNIHRPSIVTANHYLLKVSLHYQKITGQRNVKLSYTPAIQ